MIKHMSWHISNIYTVLDLLIAVGLGPLLGCLLHGFGEYLPPVRGVSEALARRAIDQ